MLLTDHKLDTSNGVIYSRDHHPDNELERFGNSQQGRNPATIRLDDPHYQDYIMKAIRKDIKEKSPSISEADLTDEVQSRYSELRGESFASRLEVGVDDQGRLVWANDKTPIDANLKVEDRVGARFVMDDQGRIFLGNSKLVMQRMADVPGFADLYAGKVMNHAAFIPDGKVISAGYMRVQNGRLLEINNHSGHYAQNHYGLSKSSNDNVIKELANKGLKAEGVRVTTVTKQLGRATKTDIATLNFTRVKASLGQLEKFVSEMDGLLKGKGTGVLDTLDYLEARGAGVNQPIETRPQATTRSYNLDF